MVGIIMIGIDMKTIISNDINNPLHVTISFKIDINIIKTDQDTTTTNLHIITTDLDMYISITSLDMNMLITMQYNHVWCQIKINHVGRKL